MDNFNNLYNFKNPIRHFFNLDNIKFDNSENLSLEDLVWTFPVKFKIYKAEDEQRTICFPNILNFYHAIKAFKNENNFSKIKYLSSKKRVSPDLKIGEFSVLSYYDAVQKDIFNLTKFDKLMILDIKSFYGRIYAHDFKFEGDSERRITSLNGGRTNGILLGSYLSLYVAERFLLQIETKLDEKLKNENIICHYEYFSDDFYFFCNNKDIDKIKTIFSKVLDEYELQMNYEKTTILDFEEYTKNNNLEKLWKKIIKISQAKDVEGEQKRRIKKNYLTSPAFFTQLVYRLSQISEIKYKRIFLANFFKTYYFNDLDAELYTLSNSDFNYICYIYKLMPEAILYSLPKLLEINGFNHRKFKEFILSRFENSLQNQKQEEQVYFYYAIKMSGLAEELKQFNTLVLQSNNQILISYFVLDKIISKEEYKNQFSPFCEKQWLQNYHYVLVYDDEDINILIPEYARKDKIRKNYFDFYEFNLKNKISILRTMEEVTKGVKKFVEDKIESYEE